MNFTTPCTVIDLFCGIGGLTHGLVLSGLQVVAGIDIDSSCRYAYEENNKPALFIEDDVSNFKSSEISALYPKDSIRILVGCAPCQPFSRYAKRYQKKGYSCNKWQLLYSFSEKIKDIRPEIISMENVPELSKSNVFVDFLNVLRELNYHIFWDIIYCPHYGVPQNRRRLVLIASMLGDISFVPQKYTQETFLTVYDAIGKLPEITAGEFLETDVLHCAASLSSINFERIKQSRPGGTWRDWSANLQLLCHKKESGYTYPSVYGRMVWNEPSPTITTQFYGYGNGRFGHPEQNRAISIREGAMLQSFPSTYAFLAPGSKLNKKQLGIHIGNAVPVNLGRAIGESIQNHILEVFENEE
jgi:DNA (cytosine-5)-methyltransferase 1